MPHPLSNLLLQTFNKLEDRLQTHFPVSKLYVSIWLNRDYNGNLILDYHVSTSNWSDKLEVQGRDPEACLAELLRRHGFKADQESLLLEPPVEPNGPPALSDEIPF